jgi:hypothetical protein
MHETSFHQKVIDNKMEGVTTASLTMAPVSVEIPVWSAFSKCSCLNFLLSVCFVEIHHDI